MDPESEKLLEETYDLVKENNVMLKKVRKVQNRAFFFKILNWVFIIGISIGAFYFLQPYVDSFRLFVDDISASFNSFKNLGQ